MFPSENVNSETIQTVIHDDSTFYTIVYLERPLEDANRELWGWVCRKPEPKVWVWFADSLQDLLEFPQPFHQQMTVLKHQPLSSRNRCLKQLQGNLQKTWTEGWVSEKCDVAFVASEYLINPTRKRGEADHLKER